MSYLILFFVALLVFLSVESFRKKQSDIAKKAVVIFSVMYSAVAVFPVSQLAYAVNTELAKSEDASYWLKGGAWKQGLPVPVDVLDTEELLSPALADIAEETENLKDFKSLLKIMYRSDAKKVKETQWCVQLIEASGGSRIRVGHQCVADSTHTEEHGKAWVVDAEDVEDWQAGTKSSFAKKSWVRFKELRRSAAIWQKRLSRIRALEAKLRAGVVESTHRELHPYKWLSNSSYVGDSSQYCLTESQLVSHIQPIGCYQLRGVPFTMAGPTSDPVFRPGNLYSGDFFVVTRADLLTKPRASSTPKVVEKTLAMLWHQKSFQAFKIERTLESFSENQKEIKKELLDRFTNLEKKQKEARDKWRNEVSEIGPQSVFTKVIE